MLTSTEGSAAAVVDCGGLDCLEAGPDCSGPVEYRERISDGRAFPRCESHADAWYERQAEISERYPVNRPSDFSYFDAGEHWSDDEY